MSDLTQHERAIVDALNDGLQTADDGTLSCPVCEQEQRSIQSYGPHWRRAHFVKLSKPAQLAVDGMSECELCGMIVAHLAYHKREHHSVAAERRARTSSAVEHVEPSVDHELFDVDEIEHANGHDVTPVDAGLAILAGLRPGSTLTVEQLPDIVDWLRQTEQVVALLKAKR